jgi:hypothetical protein
MLVLIVSQNRVEFLIGERARRGRMKLKDCTAAEGTRYES